jgi:hypothetical protein
MTSSSKMKHGARQQGQRAARVVTSAGSGVIKTAKSTAKKTSKKISKKTSKKTAARKAPVKKTTASRPRSPIQVAARQGVRSVEADDGTHVVHDDDVRRIAGAVTKHRSELMDRLAR